MTVQHVGFLDYNGNIYRFDAARCAFQNGELDVEASGSDCTLKLYGIPFPKAADIGTLPGQSFGPDRGLVFSDPMAEGGVQMQESWLSWTSLAVDCVSHKPERNTLSVNFRAEVEDSEWGETGDVDGQVVCEIFERLF